ncbi:MAG: 16S rRNA (adenine(1518)-N(6)/adenine(1519)-N(6))-dimethyltransferase RsmA [Ruminococcaceae bacterium]|nr:16S rRNA (adenine(1518)-N(6)/adenine(1519)-N(6))-dimethyltransferase RsmA [Oscillospiraceae bacterium]
MTEFKKKKQYGQNFLTSSAIPKRIAAESGITSEDCVIEIGPGFGILTRELSAIAHKVVAIEIDTELMDILPEKLSGCENVKVINADILKTDVNELIKNEFEGRNVCVCANLPYYITTDIVMKLLEGEYGFKTITVMVQKEVAERFCSKAGTAGYGAITASISYYASVKRLFTVKAGSFDPKPNVDSAVIRFDVYEKPPVAPANKDILFSVIKAAFLQRRKTLLNSLNSFFGSSLSKELLSSIIIGCGYSETVRGEELDIKGFCKIADEIYKAIN